MKNADIGPVPRDNLQFTPCVADRREHLLTKLLGTDSAAESFPTSPVGLAYLKLSFPPQNLSLLKCFDSSNTSISHLGMKTCVVDGLSVLLPTTTIPSVSNSVRA